MQCNQLKDVMILETWSCIIILYLKILVTIYIILL